jgi:drug/metabolite transporter (DMT)-like permease
MLGIVLALAASASWGSADFFGGLSTRRLSIITVSVVSQMVGLGFALVLVFATGSAAPPTHILLLGMLGGLVGTSGLAALYSGLAIGPMGVVAPIASLSVVVPVVAGLARGERPASVQLVGVALAIAGVVLAARHRDEAGTRVHPRAVLLALIAALFLGLLVVLLRDAGVDDPAWGVLMVRVGALSVLAVPLLAVRPSFAMDRRMFGTLVAVGLLDNGANLLFVLGSQRGLLSLIAVLASLYPVTTVLLARTVLHERLGRVQVAGVVAALAGVALIALG